MSTDSQPFAYGAECRHRVLLDDECQRCKAEETPKADAPTPERVTLTDEEQALIATAEVAPNSDDYDWLELIAAIEQILAARLAAREQALREEIAGECRHANVETFRSYPPHSKCLDCGQRVELRWVTRGDAR